MSSKNKNRNPLKGPGKGFNAYWIYGLIILALIGVNLYSLTSYRNDPISFSRFEKMLRNGDIEKLEVVNQKYAHIYLKKEALQKEEYQDAVKPGFAGVNPQYYFHIGPPEIFQEKIDKINATLPEDRRVDPIWIERENWLAPLLSWILPFLLIVGVWIFIMRRMTGGATGGGQIFSIGKSRAMLFDKRDKVKVTFADVAGLKEAKLEVMEIVDFLKNPRKYTALGGKIPKGVLLIGPPGTGKTLLAKAVAGEADVPFFSISGSDFVEMFVGVGASRVRDLFRQAREKAPCIVFIDEIDAIGRARGRINIHSGNDERENTLNQLLVEMDGFSTDKGVILMAATNRPDILDPALLRPGRFDRQIAIEKPDLKEREEIFVVHLRNIKTAKEVDPKVLAEMTPGFAGADIANVCNEAALIAARKNKKEVEMEDFHAALDRVIGGLEKKNKVISPREKEIIAYHESGHAICGWFLPHASPLVKVTIVPRGVGTLGYAQYLPKEEYIVQKEQILDQICMTLGGRAAEEIIFGRISTGAQNDLDHVTKIVYNMILTYGMNEKVGFVSFYSLLQDNFQKPYSEETARIIDEEARKIIREQYERAKDLLTQHLDELKILARHLLEKEVLLKSDVERLIGPRPFEEKRTTTEEHSRSDGKVQHESKVPSTSATTVDGHPSDNTPTPNHREVDTAPTDATQNNQGKNGKRENTPSSSNTEVRGD